MEFITRRATATSPEIRFSRYNPDPAFAPNAYEVEEQARQERPRSETEITERTDRRKNIEIRGEKE